MKATQHPRAGDRIEVHWPPVRTAIAEPQEIPLEILFEDDALLVINKPPGLVVHPSAGHEESTLGQRPVASLPGSIERHRRGRASGYRASTRQGHQRMPRRREERRRRISRFPISSPNGRSGRLITPSSAATVTPEQGDIRAAIARHPTHRKRMAVTDGSGREAWTGYRVLERLNQATLVEAQLHTGRTHQIRVHFKHLGFPFVGDSLYGNRQNNQTDRTDRLHADAPDAPRVPTHFPTSADSEESYLRRTHAGRLPECSGGLANGLRLNRAPALTSCFAIPPVLAYDSSVTAEQIMGLSLALLLMCAGLAGSILPGIPSTPLVLLAAIVHRLYFGEHGANNWVIGILLVLTVLSLVIDYLASMVGAKKLGASWRGVLGAVVRRIDRYFLQPARHPRRPVSRRNVV